MAVNHSRTRLKDLECSHSDKTARAAQWKNQCNASVFIWQKGIICAVRWITLDWIGLDWQRASGICLDWIGLDWLRAGSGIGVNPAIQPHGFTNVGREEPTSTFLSRGAVLQLLDEITRLQIELHKHRSTLTTSACPQTTYKGKVELWLSPRKGSKNGTYPSPPYHQMRPVLYDAFICLIIENHCCINFKCAKHGKLTPCLTHITLVCGSIWKFLKMPSQPLLKIFWAYLNKNRYPIIDVCAKN